MILGMRSMMPRIMKIKLKMLEKIRKEVNEKEKSYLITRAN